MENGLYPNLSRAEYDAMTSRVNWSRLKHISRSPAHFRHALTAEGKDTPARAFGRLAHLAILEPELFARVPTWTGARRGREWEAFRAENEGRDIATADDRDRAAAIAEAVRAHPTASQYVTGGRAEVTALWTHETPPVEGSGLPGFAFDCKARLDYVAEKVGALVDVKTCRDASPDAFGRDVWNLQYHVQAAWYRDGFAAATGRTLPFVIVAVETEPPHVVQVYRVPDWILDEGRSTYRALLGLLDRCKRERHWPGYATGELELMLPRWAVQPPDETDLADTGIVFGGA